MYKEITIDPACLREFEYYSLIKLELGFDQGRYAIVDHKQWAREAMVAVKASAIPPVRKKSITNFLNKVGRGKEKEYLRITRDRRSVKGKNWRDWYLKQREIRSFDVVLSESGAKGTVPYMQLLDGHDQWQIPPSVSSSRQPSAIISQLEPLIRVSRTITLIDPYFRLNNNRVLAELIKCASEYNIRELTLVSTFETRDPAGIYRREYQKLNRNDMKIRVLHVIPQYFHDRFFITDAGAITSGHGFSSEVQKGTPVDLVNMSIFSQENAQRTLSELNEALGGGKSKIIFSNHGNC